MIEHSSPTRMVWDLAGQPDVTAPSVAKLIADAPATCAMCGEHVKKSADADRALGSNFADRGHLHAMTDRICPACLWCCSGKPPASLRMWSIVAAPGKAMPPSNPRAWLPSRPGLWLGNRSDPAVIADTLADPPDGEWVLTVAISAQKHVLPYASVNRGGGAWTVRIEDHNVTATPNEWAECRGAALALRRLGVPADAVMNGEPRFIKTLDDLNEWRRLNRQLTPWLRSTLLDLALWTITKETMK